MQRVVLLGDMGKRFGETWEMNVDYLKDIFKLIECQRPGFKQYLLECHESGTDFTLKRGEEFVGEEELLLSVGDEDIIITAVPAGAKSGIGKLLAAIAIIAFVFFAPVFAGQTLAAMAPAGGAWGAAFTATMMVATNLALQGISQMMMPGPEVDDEVENYLFNGSSDHIKEGLPIPLCYGEMMVGGGVINQTLTTRKLYSQGMRRSHASLKEGDFNVAPPGSLA